MPLMTDNTAYPNASALAGTEYHLGIQGGIAVRIVYSLIDTYISATTKTLTNKTLGTGTAVTVAITWTDNVRQTFNPGANAAGLNVGAVATADPDTPIDGDVWYNTDLTQLRARADGVTQYVLLSTMWAVASDVSTGTSTNRAMTPGSYRDSTPYYIARGSGSYTLALTDRNTDQWVTATATVSIPLNATVAFAVGDVITVLRNTSDVVTIDAVDSVTLNGVSSGGCTISTQYQRVMLQKVATDAWVISGDHGAVA